MLWQLLPTKLTGTFHRSCYNMKPCIILVKDDSRILMLFLFINIFIYSAIGRTIYSCTFFKEISLSPYSQHDLLTDCCDRNIFSFPECHCISTPWTIFSTQARGSKFMFHHMIYFFQDVLPIFHKERKVQLFSTLSLTIVLGKGKDIMHNSILKFTTI